MRLACRFCRCEFESVEIARGRIVLCVTCEMHGIEEEVAQGAALRKLDPAQRFRVFKNSANSRSSASSPARRAGVIKLPRSA